jgi:hypothetical protein
VKFIDTKTYVVFPAERVERDRVDVLVEDEREGDDKVEDGEALGAELVGEDFERVGNDERGEGETV